MYETKLFKRARFSKRDILVYHKRLALLHSLNMIYYDGETAIYVWD